MLGDIFLEVASSPPLRGGECSPLNFRLILTSTATKILSAEIRSSEVAGLPALISYGCALSRLRFASHGCALSRLRFAECRYSYALTREEIAIGVPGPGVIQGHRYCKFQDWRLLHWKFCGWNNFQSWNLQYLCP